jgi:hypothetical protein
MKNNQEDSDSPQPSLDELIPLNKAAKFSGLSRGYLSLLIRNRDMWGTKMNCKKRIKRDEQNEPSTIFCSLRTP